MMAEPIDLNARRERQLVEARPFACTGCGTTLPTRVALEQHWDGRPDCRASLTRPAGQFGARTPGQHCETCIEHRSEFYAPAPDAPCPVHAFRGCPGC